MNAPLFPLPDATEPPVARVNAEPRVQRPNRTQRQLRPIDLEALLPRTTARAWCGMSSKGSS